MTGSMYRMFSATGDLLYVGVTATLPTRLDAHRQQPWWREVATIRVEHFESFSRAFGAEQDAIRDEHPAYNSPLTAGARGGWSRRLAKRDAFHELGQTCTDTACARCKATRKKAGAA